MAGSKLTRVPVIRNQKYKPNGLKSYVYTLNKFNIHPSKSGPYRRKAGGEPLQRTLADGSYGSVVAEDQQNDAFYICPVQIGTPPQTVQLNFDSGSSDLWVKSTQLPKQTVSQLKSAGVKIFDPAKSDSFEEIDGATWKIQYGDGSGASGTVGTDTISIGDIKVEGQAVECSTQISAQFTSEQSSGLLGLAWGNINTVKPTRVKTPVENMIAQKDISQDQALFTAYLGSVKDQTDPDGGKSFYTFGGIDQEVVQQSGQEISWTPIDNSEGFWMYESASFTVNGQSYPTSGNKAIMDTGTTLSLVADSVLEKIYGQIEGARYDDSQQGWLLPTTGAASRPKVTFAIGDKQFAIEQEQLAWAPVDDSMSYGAIQSRGDLTFDIMGDTMLICIYCIFDVGKKRLGAVQRADPTPAGK